MGGSGEWGLSSPGTMGTVRVCRIMETVSEGSSRSAGSSWSSVSSVAGRVLWIGDEKWDSTLPRKSGRLARACFMGLSEQREVLSVFIPLYLPRHDDIIKF